MAGHRRAELPPPPVDLFVESGELLATLEHTLGELHVFLAELRAEISPEGDSHA